jgi:LPXTG-site transpeptidase (sortase) family protein
MERKSRISLDDPVFRGRLKSPRNVHIYPVARKDFVNGHSPAPSLPPKHPPTVLSKPKPHQQVRPMHLPRQARTSVLNRRLTHHASLSSAPQRKQRQSHKPKVLMGMAALLLLGGIFVFINGLNTNRAVKAQVQQLSASAEDNDGGMTDGVPSEQDPPKNLGSYSVAPDLPRLLTIEKIDVSARVRRVGVGENNTMKAPASIFDVGWYEGSAKPGENGTVVLDGHVSGPTKQGVFYNLNKLKTDDTMTLTRGDGQVFTYSVVETMTYDDDKVDMPKLLTTAVVGKPGLNIITCSGKFNSRTNQYEQRTVVFAVQI